MASLSGTAASRPYDVLTSWEVLCAQSKKLHVVIWRCTGWLCGTAVRPDDGFFSYQPNARWVKN